MNGDGPMRARAAPAGLNGSGGTKRARCLNTYPHCGYVAAIRANLPFLNNLPTGGIVATVSQAFSPPSVTIKSMLMSSSLAIASMAVTLPRLPCSISER